MHRHTQAQHTHTHAHTQHTQHTPASNHPTSFPTADNVSEIQSNFTTHRESLPAMFIATPLEKVESIWTAPDPVPPILAHMRRVASKAYDVLSVQLDPPTRRRRAGEGEVPSQDIKVSLMFAYFSQSLSCIGFHTCIGVYLDIPLYCYSITLYCTVQHILCTYCTS